MPINNVRTFDQLTQTLTARGNATKAAAVKKAAGDTPTEKDPAEKGVVAVPKDPNAASPTLNLPANSTNAEVTPVTTVSPAKTVGTEAKTASLLAKANAVRAGIAGLRKAATASEITPTLVSDKGSDNKDTNPAPSTSNAPAPKQNPDPVTKDAAPVPDIKDPDATKAPAPSGDSKGDLPPETKNTNDTTAKSSAEGCMTPEAKAAAELEFTPDFHYKLASMILATEDGRAYARSVIEAAHGAAEAEDIIKAASFMEAQAQEYERLEAEGAFAAEQMWQQATPEEREGITKLANAMSIARATLPTELEKIAFDAGAQDGSDQIDATAGAADPSQAGAAAAPGGENITDDDIISVLSELVQAGKIKPEEAEAILQALQSGGAEANPTGPAGAVGADPSQAGGAGMEPQEPTDPSQKEAFVLYKSASAIANKLVAEFAPAPAK